MLRLRATSRHGTTPPRVGDPLTIAITALRDSRVDDSGCRSHTECRNGSGTGGTAPWACLPAIPRVAAYLTRNSRCQPRSKGATQRESITPTLAGRPRCAPRRHWGIAIPTSSSPSTTTTLHPKRVVTRHTTLTQGPTDRPTPCPYTTRIRVLERRFTHRRRPLGPDPSPALPTGPCLSSRRCRHCVAEGLGSPHVPRAAAARWPHGSSVT
jgi:hypothetical protein